MEHIDALRKHTQDGTEPEPELFTALTDAWDNGAFSVSADCLYACWKVSRGKGRILETGSGLTTLVMAVACENSGHVFALEHDPLWARRINSALGVCGIPNVHVIDAPLKDYGEFIWYGVSPGTDLFSEDASPFDVVLCDGPQRQYGRGGLFHLLGHKIGGILVADDMHVHDSGRETIEEWARENGRDVMIMGMDKKFAIVRPFSEAELAIQAAE